MTKAVTQFSLGQTVATPGVLAVLDESKQSATEFLKRHSCGDWGELGAEDRKRNDDALIHGDRLLSAYEARNGSKIWIITEADRSATTLLLPEEY
ncbi:MAG: hypothetical protein JSS49_23775 [Planctomycetes bacterium]|nr:hypothetical protein [Planctomycetota bacterium]